LLLVLAACGPDPSMVPVPEWLSRARILTPGEGVTNSECRTAICAHNEHTDLVRWKETLYLVHRTARTSSLGPNSSLWVYRSVDEGRNFTPVSRIEAPANRDIRAPHFYMAGNDLHMKALTRLPVSSTRDALVDTIAIAFKTTDGLQWNSMGTIGPTGWSYWRIIERGGTLYNAAYEDGDKSVVLFSSQNGLTWTRGPLIYGIAEDTPLETELIFVGDRLLALVRLDGNDAELPGDQGRLRTKVCWSNPPYVTFDCPSELSGQRFDGPLAFYVDNRLFVVARKHLQGSGRKRTALFELGGLDATVTIKEHGELPSAGDTAYAGQARLEDGRRVLSWYSGDLVRDESAAAGMMGASDIWTAVFDPTKLP
jgi:hypothetical protein